MLGYNDVRKRVVLTVRSNNNDLSMHWVELVANKSSQVFVKVVQLCQFVVLEDLVGLRRWRFRGQLGSCVR